MKLQKLHIKNYKSLVDLEIVEPNPFTVFAGPNGAGKSNIFEALEFGDFAREWNKESVIRLFGGDEAIRPKKLNSEDNIIISISHFYDRIERPFEINIYLGNKREASEKQKNEKPRISNVEIGSTVFCQDELLQTLDFNRIFIKNEKLVRVKEISDKKLNIDCANLEKVLKRLLDDEINREDITEYLELFIPGFEKIEIDSNNLSGTDTLLIYEKGINKPFTKDLISDGTYNIICLLTAVFQSDEPQFLCIEEPENGLNPYVVKGIVDLFRSACEEKGHYIWLNTHSQTLVEMLRPEELILVNKENGVTKITQPKNIDLHGLPTDEAWLSGVLGGGVPW